MTNATTSTTVAAEGAQEPHAAGCQVAEDAVDAIAGAAEQTGTA